MENLDSFPRWLGDVPIVHVYINQKRPFDRWNAGLVTTTLVSNFSGAIIEFLRVHKVTKFEAARFRLDSHEATGEFSIFLKKQFFNFSRWYQRCAPICQRNPFVSAASSYWGRSYDIFECVLPGFELHRKIRCLFRLLPNSCEKFNVWIILN